MAVKSSKNQKSQWAAPARFSLPRFRLQLPPAHPALAAAQESERKLCFAIPKQMPCQKPNDKHTQLLFSLLLVLVGVSRMLFHAGKRGGRVPRPPAPLSPSLSLRVPSQGAGSSSCSANLFRLSSAGSEEEKPQKSIGTA